MKVCVIGGGSTYTPELIEGFIERRAELPIAELVLMDIDGIRLGVVGGVAERMLRAARAEMILRLTTDREEALQDADYVIVQLRVGGVTCRIQDEKIPLRFGVVGQETTGPGGFACALRTIPLLLAIARDVVRLSPNAVLINFTNPSGIVTQALLTRTDVKTIGLCNVPIGMQRRIASDLGVEPEHLCLDYVGLNHLSWVRGATVDGVDVFDRVLDAAIARARRNKHVFSPELLETLGLVPGYYLHYYYNRDQVVAEQRQAGNTRGEEVRQIEAELLKLYADPRTAHKPKLLEQRGGAYYSTAAVALLSAIHRDTGAVHIVNVRNGGAVPGLPADAVVELPARVRQSGVHPIPTAPLPPSIRGLVQAVKAYEELTVQAAVEGDERAALQALLAHPLVPSFSVAKGLWAAIKEANRQYLPQFGGCP